MHAAALCSQPDWFTIFEISPVATVLLASRRPESSVDVGHIDHANGAARRLLCDQHLVTPQTSIFDLVDASGHGEIRRLLHQSSSVDGEPRKILLKVAHSGALVSMWLCESPDNRVLVAQFVAVPTSGVERVKAEQQRFRSALMELSELAHSTEDDDEFYQRLIERAVEVVPGAQGGSVQLNIAGTPGFRFVAAVGYDLNALRRHILEQDHFFRDTWNPVAQIVRDFDADARSPEITEWLETVGRLSEIVVNVSAPVLSGGFPIAFLSLDNFEDPDAMNATSIEMTTVLSRFIGDLWGRRQLEAELRKEREAFRHLAMHDPLSGLPNRRNLERSLADMMAGAHRSEHPSAVLFVDVDDFKGINDRLGHEMGDRVLVGVAQGLKSAARMSDVVGRWGGDEFLVLPYRVESRQQVVALGERILNYFATEIDVGEGAGYRARLSIGIGWSEESDVGIDCLIRIADRALYEAKSAGKGVVRMLDSLPD